MNQVNAAQNNLSERTKKVRHTPGPWEVIAADDYFVEATIIPRERGVVIFNLYENAICEVSNSPRDLGEANARLIAAAPDLLSALTEARLIIRQWHGMGMSTGDEIDAWNIYDRNAPEMKPINAALALAEGSDKEPSAAA